MVGAARYDALLRDAAVALTAAGIDNARFEARLLLVARDLLTQTPLSYQTAAAALHPEATPLLLTLETWPPSHAMPKPLLWRSAIEWLLESFRHFEWAVQTHPHSPTCEDSTRYCFQR